MLQKGRFSNQKCALCVRAYPGPLSGDDHLSELKASLVQSLQPQGSAKLAQQSTRFGALLAIYSAHCFEGCLPASMWHRSTLDCMARVSKDSCQERCKICLHLKETQVGSGLGIDVTPLKITISGQEPREYNARELRNMELQDLISLYKVFLGLVMPRQGMDKARALLFSNRGNGPYT